MADTSIGPGCEITLHFALALADGTLIDSNFDGAPATFTLGDGSLLPGFEQLLVGLHAGASATFDVPPAQAFGDFNADNVQRVARRLFAAEPPLTKGLVVSFADASGAETPGVVIGVDGDQVEVDFNHPLAGRTILFQVQIHAVRARRINLIQDRAPGAGEPSRSEAG